MWGAHDGMGWWMLVGSVWFIVFWGAVIYFVFWVANRAGRSERPAETPLEILKRRYARGEIGKDEFDRMRQDLT